jgi:hypothetical protein
MASFESPFSIATGGKNGSTVCVGYETFVGIYRDNGIVADNSIFDESKLEKIQHLMVVNPYGMAMGANALYVCSPDTDTLVVAFDLGNKFRRRATVKMNRPKAVCVDKGLVYVCTAGGLTVLREGSLEVIAKDVLLPITRGVENIPGHLKGVFGFAVDDGRLYACEPCFAKVYVFSVHLSSALRVVFEPVFDFIAFDDFQMYHVRLEVADGIIFASDGIEAVATFEAKDGTIQATNLLQEEGSRYKPLGITYCRSSSSLLVVDEYTNTVINVLSSP